MSSKKIGYVSLFSGGMGLDIGLENVGFRTLVCNEIDKASVATILQNRPKVPVISSSIADVSAKDIMQVTNGIKSLDLVAGGPPCQSFSVYGNRHGVHDERGQLVFEYVRMVEELRPKVFLMENVRGLHSMPLLSPKAGDGKVEKAHQWMTKKGSLLQEIISRFEAIGYRVDGYLVNSVNYGAPQIRERLLLIGNRFDLECDFPKPTHSNRPEDGLSPFATLKSAIGVGFSDPDPTLMNFSERKLKYLALVPEGGNWRSLPVDIQKESMGKSWYLKGGRSATWRRLSWEFPSPTVVTMPNHASTSMCHPGEIRALTLGECAAIQGFPKQWKFAGSSQDKYRQVGNAVPVRLGEVAGTAIKDLLKRISKIERGFVPPEQLLKSKISHLRSHVRTKRYWHKGSALAGDHDYYESGSSDDDDQEDLFAVDDR